MSKISVYIKKIYDTTHPLTGYSPKLDDLEKTLQEALQVAPNQSAPRRTSGANSGYDSDDIRKMDSSFETRQSYNTTESKVWKVCLHLETKRIRKKKKMRKNMYNTILNL